MSFYATLIVIEANDAEDARDVLESAGMPRRVPSPRWPAKFASDPWEVTPFNDLDANRDAGKWIEGPEVDDYYPNADPEFDVDDCAEQRL